MIIRIGHLSMFLLRRPPLHNTRVVFREWAYPGGSPPSFSFRLLTWLFSLPPPRLSACDAIREKDHKIFGMHSCGAIGMHILQHGHRWLFPNIDDIFGNMAATTNANGSSSASYVILYHLFETMLQTLIPPICLDLLFVCSLLDCMTSFNKYLLF
jgi:hypothetical protein